MSIREIFFGLNDFEDDVNDNGGMDMAANFNGLDEFSELQKTQRYIGIMHKIDDVNQGLLVLEHGDSAEYQLIIDCNKLCVDIDKEILNGHNFTRDTYRLKLPELESLVPHPIDYARVLKKIGNETDLTLVDLQGILPSATIMVISITASTTRGKLLTEENLNKTIDACDRVLDLNFAKNKVLDFFESRMKYIAPNLSSLVGSAVAAKLIGSVGGLPALVNMPASNIQLLGAKRRTLSGFSSANSESHVGFFQETAVVQHTPPPLKHGACKLFAYKSILAARVDLARGDGTGNIGRKYRDEISKKIENWQERPPAKLPKPLPVPDLTSKPKKRGGRRLRKTKMRYAITNMKKLVNRMQFGVPEKSSLGDGYGEGYGMLGQAGCGKMRVTVNHSRLAPRVTNMKCKKTEQDRNDATSGLTLSLPLTPVQESSSLIPGQSSYFSKLGTEANEYYWQA
ncbi:hypothetical protein IFM89_028304 [Coptis chinensis]|uniref:Nop domain-containing protein n=1 Tax=Coptis chinensis TaxID=261450 RepID=A0A835HG91_9MAGN|nr:hypothetical protein IFM89_028304 [Coptis chinensis]